MSRVQVMAAALALVVLATGCKHDRTERVAASYSSVTKPTFHPVPKVAAEPVTVGTDSVPTEEEYEERAASTITEANLEAQLSVLEHEMPF
jgi:hypothetical protein